MTTLLEHIERRSLPLTDIVRDPGLQPRAGLDDATVERYADAMAAGVQLPDVTVYHDGSVYWLADGSHRCAAADRLQRTSINAEIKRGTRRDALLHALRANTEHGLQRRPSDLRRAVELALGDPEISRESDRQIASICRCSHTYVSQIRKAQSGNSLQMGQAHRVVRRGDQVYKQAVKPTEPEPTEADIAIARDLVAEALGTWTRPVNRGSIYNQVLRLGGGAHTARKAVYTAIDRMIAAGSVLDLKDEHGRRVHALAHDPAIQAASAGEATSPAEDEMNARFDRDAITLLGRSDDGAEHRAVDVARKLVVAGTWDGQSKIEFDAYELHDKLFGVAPISPGDLNAGHDTLFFPGRPRDLEDRILDLIAASPLPAAIVCERLEMAGTADQRRAVHLALDELRRHSRVREYRGMWFIEREKTGDLIPDEFVQRVLDTLSDRPMYIYELRSRVGGTESGYDLRALLTRLEAEGKVSHSGNLYQIVKADENESGEQPAQPDDPAPEPDEREEVPEDNTDGDESGCLPDQTVVKPDPDEQLPTPTAKDAGRVRDLLKRHAPMPLRMKYIREQLDMGDSDFYRARMLLMGGGEVVQDGESLRLVVAPPERKPSETPDAATQLAQVFVDLHAALERLQAIDATAIATLSADLRAALHEQQSALLTLFGATLLHLDLGDEGDAAE